MLERRRQTTVDRLALAYALGHLATDSLEHRLEVALAAADPDALVATLWGLPGRTATDGSQLELGGRLLAPTAERAVWVVGRSRSCDVCLPDPAVSARHARVACRGGRWTVADLESTNGTWVNGARVTHATLAPDDELVLGESVARLAGWASALPHAPTPS